MWKFSNPVKIYFGREQFAAVPSLVKSKAALITTPGSIKRGSVDRLKEKLGPSLVSVFSDVTPNPTFSSIKEAYINLKSSDFDYVLAIGGGSTIDTAKAVAANGAAGDDGWLDAHLRQGRPFPSKFHPKPIIAVPTTAGSGSEVTKWATIWDNENKKKYSVAHSDLFPKIAVLDPELTLTLPEQETIYSALDACTHAMEAIWSKNSNPLSDLLAIEAISLIYNKLPQLKKDLKSIDLRSSILRASLFAGLAFSNTRTALAHSLSYPFTARFGIPHGLACSLALPHVAKYNCTTDKAVLEKISSGLNIEANPERIMSSLVEFLGILGIKGHLKEYGVVSKDIEIICNDALGSGRAENNIIDIDKDRLTALVRDMM